MEFQEAIDIIKAKLHKYFKREGVPGKYKYYYTKEEYDKTKDIETEFYKIPLDIRHQLMVNELPQKKVNYKDIKGIGDLSIYINNPKSLDGLHLKSAKKIYNELLNGGKIKNTISVDKNFNLLDGQNRIAAQLALGITDFNVAIVDESFYNKPINPKIIEKYKQSKQQDIKAIIKKHEADILKKTGNKFEACKAIDENGNVIFEKTGEKSQISFNRDEMDKLKGIHCFTHNHPAGKCFSKEDFYFAIAKGIKEIRACVEKDSVNQEKGAWVFKHSEINNEDKNYFMQIYEQAEAEIMYDFKKKVESSNYNNKVIKECELIHHVEVMKKVVSTLKDRDFDCEFYFEKA